MSAVIARDIVKKFAEVPAVNGISLSIPDGEFMVLLGPSGCGKTTFLRIICGLEQQTSGDLMIGGAIAGYATIGKNRARELSEQGEIYELYMLPEYQGIGLGSRLFSAARRTLADHGLKGMVVWALEENQNALSFYAGAGGRDVAEGVEVFEHKALKKIAFVWE